MIPGGEPAAQHRVGAVMLVLILLAGVFVVIVLPRLDLRGGTRVQIAFAHVGALHEGAPVVVAGRTIGKVDSIALVPEAGLPADHPLAGIGGAVVHARIDDDQRWKAPVNGDYFISSRGVLSSRYVEIGPPRDGAAPGRPIGPDDLVRGADPPSIDRALQRTWDNLVRSREFLEAVGPEARALGDNLDQLSRTLTTLEPGPGEWLDLVVEVRGLMREYQTLRDHLAEGGADPEQLAALIDRARATVARGRAALATLRGEADRLAAEVGRITDHAAQVAPDLRARVRAGLDAADQALGKVDRLLADAQQLAALVRRGEGSLARLSNDPEFPEDAKELGRILKRTPWRVIGHPDDSTAIPRPPRPR